MFFVFLDLTHRRVSMLSRYGSKKTGNGDFSSVARTVFQKCYSHFPGNRFKRRKRPAVDCAGWGCDLGQF